MKSKRTANARESKLLRRRCLFLTSASLSALFAAPAIAEMRLNPFVVPATVTKAANPSPQETIAGPLTVFSETESVKQECPKRLPVVASGSKSGDLKGLHMSAVADTTKGDFRFIESEVTALPEFRCTPVTESNANSLSATKANLMAPIESDVIAKTELELALELPFFPAPENEFASSGMTVSNAIQSPGEQVESTPRRLRSTTAQSTYRLSRQYLDQAINEYQVGAWASSEASVWNALNGFAEAADFQQHASESSSSTSDLSFAVVAIRESRDFNGQPVTAIPGIAVSHQTKLLTADNLAQLSTTDASDLYLDEARIRLGRLATLSADAAEAMDLLAAIYLGRNDADLMPGPTALCLRRAALQGQPSNGSLATRLGMQLADTGLHDEAYLVLQHAYEISPTQETANVLDTVARACGKNVAKINPVVAKNETKQNSRRPDVIQLSPSDFAAISQPVMQVASAKSNSTAIQRVGHEELSDESMATGVHPSNQEENQKPSAFNRITGPFKRLWQ